MDSSASGVLTFRRQKSNSLSHPGPYMVNRSNRRSMYGIKYMSTCILQLLIAKNSCNRSKKLSPVHLCTASIDHVLPSPNMYTLRKNTQTKRMWRESNPHFPRVVASALLLLSQTTEVRPRSTVNSIQNSHLPCLTWVRREISSVVQLSRSSHLLSYTGGNPDNA